MKREQHENINQTPRERPATMECLHEPLFSVDPLPVLDLADLTILLRLIFSCATTSMASNLSSCRACEPAGASDNIK